MEISSIKNKAKMLGITPDFMSRTELIHAIQRAEHNTPCYGSSDGQCIYTECCFRDDCLKPNTQQRFRKQITDDYLNKCLAIMRSINGD